MRSSPKPAILALGAALSLAQAVAAPGDATGKKPAAETKDPAKKSKDDKKPAKKTPASDEPEELSVPIPDGEPQKVVKFPIYSGDGKLDMRFEIGVATKVDEKMVKMEKLRIETYKDDEKTPAKQVVDMNMDLPDAMLNRQTWDMTSETAVKIKRDAFEVTGNSMKFNLKTRQGTLSGGVKMIIYDIEKLDGGAEKPTVEFQPPKEAQKK